MASSNRSDLVIAGGGTGGHFFCGVAIGEYFLERHPHAQVLFVGSKNGIEARTKLNNPKMKRKFVQAAGFKNKNPMKKILALFMLAGACLESLFILIQARPRVVIGVGGYASAALILTAIFLKPFLRYRLFVVDQNSSPGMANKIFVKLGVDGFSPFPAKGFHPIHLLVRQGIRRSETDVNLVKWPPQTFLIMGGSQGAHGVNQAWLKMLNSVRDFVGEGFRVLHQTGRAQEAYIRAIYEDQGIEAEVFAFSDEMQKYYRQADIIISRAGALSIFEIIHFERPAVFVPFPFAADNHQYHNARAVQKLDWIVSEEKFNWGELKRILDLPNSSKPAFPSARSASWDQLLR